MDFLRAWAQQKRSIENNETTKKKKKNNRWGMFFYDIFPCIITVCMQTRLQDLTLLMALLILRRSCGFCCVPPPNGTRNDVLCGNEMCDWWTCISTHIFTVFKAKVIWAKKNVVNSMVTTYVAGKISQNIHAFYSDIYLHPSTVMQISFIIVFRLFIVNFLKLLIPGAFIFWSLHGSH